MTLERHEGLPLSGLVSMHMRRFHEIGIAPHSSDLARVIGVDREMIRKQLDEMEAMNYVYWCHDEEGGWHLSDYGWKEQS